MLSNINLLLTKLLVNCIFGIFISIGCSPALTSTFNTPPQNFTQTITPTTFTSTKSTIILSSLTPLPTIPLGEETAKLDELFSTNGGCHLPCFWGITPGKTTVSELLQFAKQFSMAEFELVNIGDGVYIFRYLRSPVEVSRWNVKFVTDSEKIRGIEILAETAQYSFPLSSILREYGEPEKILIGPKAFEALPIIILYEDRQIMGSYYLYPDKTEVSLYCYNPGSSSQEIITWAHDEKWHSFTGSIENYKPIDEISDHDIPSFHENLKNPDQALCMKIQ